MVFDYFNTDTGSADKGYIDNSILKRPGKFYVFCSHSHPDHFSKKIMNFKKEREVIFIFSSEIKQRYYDKDIIYLDKGESYCDDTIKASAFGSTDAGASFVIQTGTKTIFHAGDLNNWHWMEESTKEEVLEAQRDYLGILEDIYEKFKKFDCAMFPVDPRLGKDYMLGAEQFLQKFGCGVFVPMHFWNNFKSIETVKDVAEKAGAECILWTKRGQTAEI